LVTIGTDILGGGRIADIGRVRVNNQNRSVLVSARAEGTSPDYASRRSGEL
jgi:hypothetical protein